LSITTLTSHINYMSSPSLSSLISRNGLSESPGIRIKQSNGLYSSSSGIPNPDEVGNSPFSRTVKRRNKMGYYYNTSDDLGEDVHVDVIAAQRRGEASIIQTKISPTNKLTEYFKRGF
jgi:hypothetical protein